MYVVSSGMKVLSLERKGVQAQCRPQCFSFVVVEEEEVYVKSA